MRTLVLTCTPERFDVAKYFNMSKEIVWRQTKKCEPGDLAYIYVGRPLSCIKYICKVIETDISPEAISLDYYQNQTATVRNKNKPYMKIQLLQELNHVELCLPSLLEHGLKTVQCTTEASAELNGYIRSIICNKK